MNAIVAFVIFLLMGASLSTSAIAAESPYAANSITGEVKHNAFSLTVEQDAVLGIVGRFNAFTCVKTPGFSLVIEQYNPLTREWRWIFTKRMSGLTMESDQSFRVPLEIQNLGIGLYRVSLQNVLVQAGRGACGTRKADWLPTYQTESVIFEVGPNGSISAPKVRDIHRMLAFDGIAYLDKIARFAVVSSEPFSLTLYQEWGSEKFVFRQIMVEDTLPQGKWNQLTIERFFPDSFRDNLPVKYTMTGMKSGVSVFGIFAPPI